jgi:hypothetical protein
MIYSNDEEMMSRYPDTAGYVEGAGVGQRHGGLPTDSYRAVAPSGAVLVKPAFDVGPSPAAASKGVPDGADYTSPKV